MLTISIFYTHYHYSTASLRHSFLCSNSLNTLIEFLFFIVYLQQIIWSQIATLFKTICNIPRVIGGNTPHFKDLHILSLKPLTKTKKRKSKKIFSQDSNLWLVQPADIAWTVNCLSETVCLPFDVRISLILSQSQQFCSGKHAHRPSGKISLSCFPSFPIHSHTVTIGVTDYRKQPTPLLFPAAPRQRKKTFEYSSPIVFICCSVKIIFSNVCGMQ